MFLLGHGHNTRKFSHRYLENKFGNKFSPRGCDTQIFVRGDYSSSRAIRLKKFGIDRLKTSACRRVRKFKKNVILPPLRLSPGAQGGPAPKIFFAYFFLGLGHDSRKFANRYLEKNFGKKIPPGGPTPKIFQGWLL